LNEVEEFRIIHFIMTSLGEAIVLSPPELQQKILDAAEKIKKNQAAINSTT
jgi:predicted DNA-binding transcriptional regulator YafY